MKPALCAYAPDDNARMFLATSDEFRKAILRAGLRPILLENTTWRGSYRNRH